MKKYFLLKSFACFACVTSPSSAALVLEFHEVGESVVLSYSGEVTLTTTSFYSDAPLGLGSTLQDTALFSEGAAPRIRPDPSGSAINERHRGTDLYDTPFVGPAGKISSDIGGFGVSGEFVQLYSILHPSIVIDGAPNLFLVSANDGGILHNANIVFDDFSYDKDFYLKNTETDVLIDLWRVSGTTSNDYLIQFRLNSVPEPSSVVSLLLGSAGLLFSRLRKS